MITQSVTLEIGASLTGRMERNDYGVPGSPVWYELDPDSIEIETVEINGVDYDHKTLVEKMGKQGADFLFGLLTEAADGEWEQQEEEGPDYDDARYDD